MIEFINCTLLKEKRTIVAPLNVQLSEQHIGIIGHNGSGKSSFARLMNGLEHPTAGKVTVDGLCTRDQKKQVLGKVGFVFQNPDNQIVYPIVREDLAFGLKNLKLSADVIDEKIEQVASTFNLQHLLDRMIHTLSGGEKQLIALLGVLIMSPEYIVLDEPTTLLDLFNKKKLMDILYQLPQKLVIISHDLEFLLPCHRVICFEKGHILADTTASKAIELYKRSALC